MLRQQELGDWRRTCYSSQLTPYMHGKEVTVFGWVASVRIQGKIIFLIIRDKDGEIQITLRKGISDNKLIEKVLKLKPHSSIGVKGTVKKEKKAPRGAEIIPKEIKVLSLCKKSVPFKIYAKTLPSIDKRLDIRAVDLRRPKAQALLKIRSCVIKAMRDYLLNQGYIEVNTPKIIASATEGGAALFPLLYYDKEAFLTQSPQLYKEQLVMAFERVFEVGPAFRAEKSKTPSHLSEFTSFDVEEAYVNYKDIMDLIERICNEAINYVKRSCDDELKLLNVKLDNLSPPYSRVTYDEAVKILKEEGIEVTWGDDFGSIELDVLAKRMKGFYFIVDWPIITKPFYIKPARKKGLSESFDFMFNEVEIASGGTRISSRKMLEKMLKDKGLKPTSFEFHLKVFDYGMPPHAGFGLGIERFVMAITRIKNIREVVFFPRDQFRLTP